jgi:hypothetical protein
VQTTGNPLPEHIKKHHNTSQNLTDNLLQHMPISSSDMQKLSELNYPIYADANRHLNIIQQGFTLNGICQINPAHQAVLIATAGELVIATHLLSTTESAGGDTDLPMDQVSVDFSILLDLNLMNEIVHQSIKFTLFNRTQRVLLTLPVSELIINALGSDFKVESIAPSYGFLGGGKNEPLKVNVDKELRSLTLSIDQKNGYLNLRGLTFFDADNKPIPVEGMSVTCSSSHHPDPHSKKLIQEQGFHSKKEDNPWFTVTFKEHCFVKRIEVANRRDKWGMRAQKLRVSVVDTEHAEYELYSPFSKLSIATFLLKTFDFIGTSFVDAKKEQPQREVVLDQLLATQKNIAQTKENVYFLLNFISSWSPTLPTQNLRIKELQILAAYIFENTKKFLNSSLIPFTKILPYTNDIEVLEKAFNELRAKNELPLIKFTKHGIAEQGMLVQNVPKVVKTLEIVMHDLAEMGLRPCLAYGTLLGAYREKQFISHDDDVDILIEFADDNLTRGQAYAQRERLIEKLDLNKYRISTAKVDQNLNIHLFLKETNIMIDVFPYWHEKGKDSLHMEKMAVRSIPSQILAERTEVELAGKKFMAPGDIEGFLVERYGETWHVSDKYHEWLWPIKTLQAENQES